MYSLAKNAMHTSNQTQMTMAVHVLTSEVCDTSQQPNADDKEDEGGAFPAAALLQVLLHPVAGTAEFRVVVVVLAWWECAHGNRGRRSELGEGECVSETESNGEKCTMEGAPN